MQETGPGNEWVRAPRFTRAGAESEFFEGPHSIHGVGTFEFPRRHLGWPKW